MRHPVGQRCGLLLAASALLGFLALSLPLQSAEAATPASGTLSLANPTLTYTYGPNFVSNVTAQVTPDGSPNCNPAPCDHYALTIDLPADFNVTQPGASIKIETSFPAGEDYDVYLMNAGETVEQNSAATGNDPEVMNIP